MYQTDEAKIYYLYMLSDGEASKKEKELFTTICKELYIDADEKKRIIKECEKIPSDGIFDEIKELAGDPVEETEKLALMASIRSVLSNLGNRETILWNLINLGYADSKYTYEEREIVDFLKNHWKVAEDLYEWLNAEKIDVMLDDRDERPGVKFKDMDLIGIPIRITVGNDIDVPVS